MASRQTARTNFMSIDSAPFMNINKSTDEMEATVGPEHVNRIYLSECLVAQVAQATGVTRASRTHSEVDVTVFTVWWFSH